MTGWHVSIYRQADDGVSPATLDSQRGGRLAVWQAEDGGLQWLDELVRDGVLESRQGLGFFVAKKRQVYSKAERLRRLRKALDAFIREAVFLDFTDDEVRRAVDDKLAELDRAAKVSGA